MRGGAKINLEAYEAYHNTKDNALLLSQTQSEECAPKDTQPGSPKEGAKDGGNKVEKATVAKGKDSAISPKTVTTNNFTTVHQQGANINITNINNHHTYVIYR